MRDVRQAAAADAGASVLFLTPCHATPYYTHVHAPVNMAFLDCSPPGAPCAAPPALAPGRAGEGACLRRLIRCRAAHAGWQPAVDRLNPGRRSWLSWPAPCPPGGGGRPASERACFERDPGAYLRELLQLNARPAGPSLLVGYEEVLAPLGGLLERHGYRLRRAYRNCWLQTDDDTPCALLLYARDAAGRASGAAPAA
jgi:phosphatidylinositol glycan class B